MLLGRRLYGKCEEGSTKIGEECTTDSDVRDIFLHGGQVAEQRAGARVGASSLHSTVLMAIGPC